MEKIKKGGSSFSSDRGMAHAGSVPRAVRPWREVPRRRLHRRLAWPAPRARPRAGSEGGAGREKCRSAHGARRARTRGTLDLQQQKQLDRSVTAPLSAESVVRSVVRFLALPQLAKAGHYLLEDSPVELRDAILECCTAWRAELIAGEAKEAGGVPAVRTPEALGIRALPQFASLDEARSALAPRKVPTAAAIAEALQTAREGAFLRACGKTQRARDSEPGS